MIFNIKITCYRFHMRQPHTGKKPFWKFWRVVSLKMKSESCFLIGIP